MQGEPGEKGEQGPIGLRGFQGSSGQKGDRGEPGPRGLLGATGQRGVRGKTGSRGAVGPKGETGAVGPKGETGAVGPKGETGAIAVLAFYDSLRASVANEWQSVDVASRLALSSDLSFALVCFSVNGQGHLFFSPHGVRTIKQKYQVDGFLCASVIVPLHEGCFEWFFEGDLELDLNLMGGL
ncbi:MAG: hypothetical protein ACPGWR_00920 [Ardenticatenaceae bacterium]